MERNLFYSEDGMNLPYSLPTNSEKNKILREAITSGGLVIIPGVYNSAVVQLAEKNGYKAAYIGGAITTLGMGLPDLGIITLDQMAYEVKKIASITSLPVIVDVDTGYGNAAKTTKVIERAGASGFHMEDQIELKKCGHLSNKQVIPAEGMVKKIRKAARARKDPNFVIIARTDSRGVVSMEDAVRRAWMYVEAGADVIFPEALQSKEEFQYFAAELEKAVGRKVPLLANMTEYGKTPYITAEEFGSMGYNLILFPVTTLRASLKTVEEVLLEIKNAGNQKRLVDEGRLKTREELQELIRYKEWEDMVNEQLSKKKVE